MARYGCIVLIFLAGCVAVITKLSITTLIEAKGWNDRAARELQETVPLPPERGNILSCNGNILACNQTLYDIRIDVRHPKLNKLTKQQWNSLDSLADSLDTYYPRTELMRDHPDRASKDSWHTLLHEQLALPQNQRRKPVVIGRKQPIEEFERIKTWPFLKDIKGRGPVYSEDHVIRVYPFGDMARLSIGRVYQDSATKRVKGYAGLEMALDSLLYGKPGKARKVAMNSGLANWVDVPPVRGYDILTTIDIDIQDIVEEELLNMCDSVGAEWGTAIIMEVGTGEIKAISNVERNKKTGVYEEAMNRAVQAFEPGSVMKPISLMIAFEDGIVNSVNDPADCSPFMGTSDHAGGGSKSMKQIIETSSNPGIARVIFRKYGKTPEKFRERLASIGFFDKMNSGIGGETTPRVPKLLPTVNGQKRSLEGRQMDLARQAYGYNTEIPPLYTLSYYNAIANGGKYVRPHLVRALRNENGRDSILPLSYIRDSVCSVATARKVKECLHEVVWGKRGTGRRLQDDRVEVCGKTGTAYPYDYEVLKSYDKSKRRYAFAGFFPYNEPKYSCMVLITAPAGATSAARSSGTVLLNVALKLYARGLLSNHSSYAESRNTDTPLLYGAIGNATRAVATALGLSGARQIQTSGTQAAGTVPDVSGLDISSAVKRLEKAGLNVGYIRGAGFVAAQTPSAGSPLKKGQMAYLTLSWKTPASAESNE